MPVCPYENHRLRFGADGCCERCRGDVRLYAVLHQRSVALYNEARRQWTGTRAGEAATLALAALGLREQFAEAHWLLAIIALDRGEIDDARRRFDRARQLGARLDPLEIGELDVPPGEERPDVSAAVEEDGAKDV
jgi:hypothetical protein